MDSLGQLLHLAHVQVMLDTRCLLGGAFRVEHAALAQAEAMFHCVLAGRCRLRLQDGRRINLQVGDFLLLPQGDAHVIANHSARRANADGAMPALSRVRVREGQALPLKTNLSLRQLSVEGSADLDLLCGRYRYSGGAGQLLTRWLPQVLHTHLPQTVSPDVLQALMSLLRAEASGDAAPASHAVISGIGQVLLGLALRGYAQQEHAAPEGVLQLLLDERLAPSIRALLAQPQRPWTIDTLADEAAMSRATYARHFRRVADGSVAAFVLQVRMMHACSLLERTQQSVADVAQAVGYASEVSFGAAFRRLMGETPARWRRAARNVAAL